jgi:outer membrane protein TolC
MNNELSKRKVKKMKRGLKTAAAVFFGCLVAVNGVFADTVDVSFDAAVKMIVDESQDLKKAEANLKKAAAGLDVTNANRWFSLEGTGTYMNIVNVRHPGDPLAIVLPANVLAASPVPLPARLNIPDTMFMAGATLTQPLYTFGKIGNAVDSARSAIKMAETGKAVAFSEVRYAAAQLYWTAKMTEELVEIAQNSYDKAAEAKRLLTSAGRANRSNLVKISADLASKEIALSNAKFNRDSAHHTLKVMAGIDESRDLNLTTEIPSRYAALDAAPKLESTSEWDLYEQQAKMYEQSAKSRRAARNPTLAATASYSYVSMGADYNPWGGGHSDSQSAYWGLAMTVPIWDGGAARANATLDAMDAEVVRQDLDKSKRVKSNEYATAIARHQHMLGNLKSLEEARDLAHKAYDISESRFASGQTSAVELADVEAGVAQMEMALLDARVQILMAAEEVKKISGNGGN